jgi:hypothetical protein
MTAPIEDVSTLPGKKISDQAGTPIGEVKGIYATDGYPMWVAVEMSSGVANKRIVFIPLARIKDGVWRTPASSRRRTPIRGRTRVESGCTIPAAPRCVRSPLRT